MQNGQKWQEQGKMSNWSTGTKTTKCKKGEKVKNGQKWQMDKNVRKWAKMARERQK